MTTNPNAPQFVLAAVMRIYNELPSLVGAEVWHSIRPQVDTHITTLEKQPDAFLTSTQLLALLAQYEPARQAFTNEMKMQETIMYSIMRPLADMNLSIDDSLLAAMFVGMEWNVDPATIPSSDENMWTRSITMKDGGIGDGRSVKFKNLDLDFSKMMTICGGFFLAGQDMLDKPNAFVIAGTILVMIGTLFNEMTVKIEQQEATVFWGFIQVTNDCQQDRQTDTKTIFTTTNTERKKRELPPLTREQFDHSLAKLAQLGSIAKVENTDDSYRIIERFKIKR